ncbi:protein rep, partial [Acinetobacter baumannii]
VLKKNRKLKPVLITFTVKNGSDLAKTSAHLMKSFRTLMERRRDYLKKGRGFNEFCKINGAMYSYENTFNNETKEWNVHLHMFALLDDWIIQSELSEYWHSITGDSYVVDIRRIKKEKGLGYSKAAAEVCKYALKFGDLSVENTWEAFKALKGKRLSGAFGSLYGVKIPENLADELPEDKDLPYLEMLYKFVYGKQSYYDLAMTRHVEPKNKDTDNDDEEEVATTDGGGGSRRGLAQAVGRGREDCTEGSHGEPHRPQYKRKKQRWQVSPYVKVRVKNRIRRWDGYLYVIHI